MGVSAAIKGLVDYANYFLEMDSRDETYYINTIVDMIGLPVFDENEESTCPLDLSSVFGMDLGLGNKKADINELLDIFVDECVKAGLFEKKDGPYWCDKVMGLLSMPPSSIESYFSGIANSDGNSESMHRFYDYCVANTYVKKAVLDKNPRFDSHGLVVTINLAKPEFRDPKKAASGNSVKGGYPKCVICQENVGFAARSKCTLRTLQIDLGDNEYFWQFSPYGYFKEHGICVNKKHTPMCVDRQTLWNLTEFVRLIPDYFLGCNAALPCIGGSVLAHDHYQGGGEVLPLFNAKLRTRMKKKCYEDVSIATLDWPGTCIRISGKSRDRVIEIADRIREHWNNYTNLDLGIVCRDEEGQHNAISPTVIKRGDVYEMNIILRCNITSEQYPDGVFHAHPEFHSIKKESIGLIEAQGLFILPGRLVGQLAAVEQCILDGKLSEELEEFRLVYEETKALVVDHTADGVHQAMQDELGSICYRILQNTAVFKDEEQTVQFLEEIGFERV